MKNKIGIILVLMLTLLFSIQVFAETEPTAAEVKLAEIGDTDKNGELSLRDAVQALRYAANIDAITEENKYRADVDANQLVNIEDALIIFESVLNGKNFGYEYVGDDENVILVDSGSHYFDGENMYNSLAEVVKYLNANPPANESERITVLFAPGVYREHTLLTAPYITFRAMYPESEEKANITFYYGCGKKYYSLNQGSVGTSESPSFTVKKSAHDFIAENMMFENSYNIYITEEELTDYCPYDINTEDADYRGRGDLIRKRAYQTQALALCVDADRCQFINCDIIGRQDTLLLNGNGNRVYFEECFIEGTVDFIYGNGTAVFESCTINAPYHSGHITAGSHTSDIKFGFLFKDCSLTRTATTPSAAPEDGSYSLGRNWHNQPMVCYWNCKMDKHIYEGIEGKDVYNDNGEWLGLQIIDGRWRPMGDESFITKENSRFSEVGTMDIDGNPIELTRDICPDFEEILEQSDMQPGGKYAAHKWLAGNDGWNPGGYPEN